jgi:hypothetical protein
MPFVNNELDDTTYEHESSTIGRAAKYKGCFILPNAL